ncbi:WLM domain-containing protein [Mycena indigotica]|uniref:WLM domain-containing protein n=1 Tax=Mycena indigotica TaxID=2126181 RepID=A0A8H6WAA3_9AGAR|nr:WLM domain-containing protein [Mycena indigotica]KAF7307428.1 WLM domain-containing protein [Mycena indigotica]
MSTDVFVQSFTHVKGPPKQEARALEMLKRVASLVKPIMRKHGWVLPTLSEFFPAQSNLLGLNVNGGQKILLRLRPSHAPDTFLEEADVVQTMLHELTHNVHGPHDEKFYKFLSGLQEEYDALQRSGYAGEGFYSKGNRLGTNISHNLPPHLARSKAIEAAEKRKQTAQVLGGGGRRLGTGRLNVANMSPRELAARAAELRARDEKECGSGEMAQREAEKAANESVKHDVIDLTVDSDDEVIVTSAPTTTKPVTSSKNNPVIRAASKLVRPTKPEPTSQWTCEVCTLINSSKATQCDACLSNRPPNEADGWGCLFCGETGMPHEFWSCRSCGAIKPTSTV